jgi:hypothetical protein
MYVLKYIKESKPLAYQEFCEWAIIDTSVADIVVDDLDLDIYDMPTHMEIGALIDFFDEKDIKILMCGIYEFQIVEDGLAKDRSMKFSSASECYKYAFIDAFSILEKRLKD